ncbi:MAG: DUF1573 domain-containing protein [Symbiobacterium sp.]|uniref:DUF1573 domain-containing protein n=1 Tax=Symbiobacterium sp. TaxID=1971213 RepID=UPI0034639DB5
MKDLLCDQFQDTVNEYLIRHRSVLDIMAKLQESQARVNRAITKAVTSCGCVQVHATRQQYPADATLEQLRDHVQSHVSGKLCDHCREVVEAELGNSLFYLAALCNTFDLNLYDIILQEQKKLSALGVYNFAD